LARITGYLSLGRSAKVFEIGDEVELFTEREELGK
jgi:hypothetical protein